MDISLQHNVQPSTFHFPQDQAPSSSDEVTKKAAYQAKKVSEHDDVSSVKEQRSLASRAWSSVKSAPRDVSIFCRSVYKVLLIGYYAVKHKAFGVKFTSDHLHSYLQKLGPAYAKVFQAVGSEEGLLNNLADYLGSSESDRKEFARVIRDFLDNNPEIPASIAKSILDKAGSKGHVVKKHLATGTIGSCFEVEKDGKSYVAKVVPDWKASDIESGIKSMRMLFPFMPKLKTTIKELTDPFMGECNLLEERRNHIKFKDTLKKVKCTEVLNSIWLPHPQNQVTLTFKAPNLIEDVKADNLLLMEKIHDGYTLNTLTKPENSELRSQLYQKCFGEPMTQDFLLPNLLEDIHQQAKAKWLEMATKHGFVHCDCHPGNIMLNFRQNGHVDVWFVDFGNCLTISENQRKLYPEIVHLLSDLLDPFTSKKLDEAKMDRLVDILWNRVAVGHKDKGPISKRKFKNTLMTKFASSRNPMATVDQATNLTPKEKEELKKNLDKPFVQNVVRIILLSLISASLSSVCHAEGLKLPSSFTRYVGAHFRAGVVLDVPPTPGTVTRS